LLLRSVVVVAAALVPLCLPVGGGKGARVPILPPAPASDPSGAEPTPAPELPLPAILPDNFPRFLRTMSGEIPTPRPASKRHVREVMLTFDDGPDFHGTPLVLDALDRHGWKGIFFVNGRYLLGSRPEDLSRRDMVRKLAAHGHLVANHTLTHRNLCREPAAVSEEIDTNSEIIAYATGLRPLLFRSPYGARCRSLDQALRERDLVQVGWNLDPQEWRASDQNAVFTYVTQSLAQLRGRAILLLHDKHPAAVRALPRILAWIDQENARVAREGGVPIRVVDYSVFVPQRPPPPPTGLEPLAQRLASSLSVLAGLAWAPAPVSARPQTAVARVE
jgi:peptidoglycan/xylan/chitin deacetylase (PgdA/CDA1 family)